MVNQTTDCSTVHNTANIVHTNIEQCTSLSYVNALGHNMKLDAYDLNTQMIFLGCGYTHPECFILANLDQPVKKNKPLQYECRQTATK